MPKRRLLVLLFLLLGCVAGAQDVALSGSLREVRVVGTSTETADLIRAIIVPRPGTPVESINLEAERNRIYGFGIFEEVSLSLEDRGAGPVLVIRVVENPTVAEIRFFGNDAISAEQLRGVLERENLLETGRILNTGRAEDALGTIQRQYRAAGFPFDVQVTLDIEEIPPLEEGDAAQSRLSYTISEAAPLERIAFEGNTVLDDDVLEEVFRGLAAQDEFDIEIFLNHVREVSERYRELGFRESGVDPNRTELANGTLTVRLRELTIVSVDTTALGVDPDRLSLGPGDLYNYDVLLDDVKQLAAGRSADVRLVPRVTSNGEVRVVFELGAPETAGPIDEIAIEGNTVVSSDELRGLLELEVGDTFTSTLASEDFLRIAERYREAGWLITGQPRFNYLDGTYVQRVTELKIESYQVTFEGGRASTETFVVTRYMPVPGQVANDLAIIQGLRQVARLGAVQPVGREYLPGSESDQVIVNLIVRPSQTGVFSPSAEYATDRGFSANLSYSESNFLGRAHDVSAEVSAQNSDVGLLFGGSVSYRVPWLYLDVLDFREVPTDVSLSLFSRVAPNRPLSAFGSARIAYEGSEVLVGEYTQRDSGASFSVGRPVLPNTTLRFRAAGSYSSYLLEPPGVACEFDDDGDVTNPERCSLPRERALAFLPQSGLSTFISTSLTYDDRDNPDFPRSGLAVTGAVGVGLGTDFRNPDTGEQQAYDYEQVEFGIKTYVLLRDIAPDEVTDPNHVFAFRFNAGHQFGELYPESRRFRVGRTTSEATGIRGYFLDDFNLSQTYATGSVEYRYDFGFSSFATQTIIGIVFADVGWASSVPNFADYETPFFTGFGIGVQVNLGIGGVILPALRFDYGFSERNPAGEFRFRVGPVF